MIDFVLLRRIAHTFKLNGDAATVVSVAVAAAIKEPAVSTVVPPTVKQRTDRPTSSRLTSPTVDR